MSSTIAEKLRAAAALLKERGWCQHVNTTRDGRLDLTGALAEVDGMRTGPYSMVSRELARREGRPRSLNLWQDEKGRTLEEVLALLLAAATAAQKEEDCDVDE